VRDESQAYEIELAAAVVYWHVPALAEILAIGKELAHEFLQRVASLLEDASLSVLDEDDVFRQEGGGRAHRNPLLACRHLHLVRRRRSSGETRLTM